MGVNSVLYNLKCVAILSIWILFKNEVYYNRSNYNSGVEYARKFFLWA